MATNLGSIARTSATARGHFAARLPDIVEAVAAAMDPRLPPSLAAGTRVATPAGGVDVEQLRPGMRILAASGASVAVVAVSHRRVDCRRHPRPREVWPVRIRAGALRRAVPERDLWLSPDHLICDNDVLIPLRQLLNGTSIAQQECDSFTWFHIATAGHDAVWVEGLLVEALPDGDEAAVAPATAVPVRAAAA